MNKELVAPCGMNCGICSGYLAKINDVKHAGINITYCAGCRAGDKQCAILKKKCGTLQSGSIEYCYECREFPCDRLAHLDKRYRTLFRMSMIDNLKYINENGIESFLNKELEKWRCPECGGVISCHNGVCFKCGLSKLKNRKQKYRWETE